MKKFLEIIIAIVLLAGIAFISATLARQEKRAEIEEAKKSKENVDLVHRYDSIISSIERKMLDSIRATNTRLEQFKTFQHDENTFLRKRNTVLEKRFRDLDLSDRPEF